MKYIINVPDIWHHSYDKIYKTVQLKFCGKDFGIEATVNGEPYTEPDRQAVENEVWEFAWEVLQLDLPVFREIFGYDTDKMDYREYKSKYEAWKKQKERDEVRVGDEIEAESGSKACVFCYNCPFYSREEELK